MKDLKCTIIITGKGDDGNVSVNVEFDPAYKEGEGYENSGVGRVAGSLLIALQKIVGSSNGTVEM